MKNSIPLSDENETILSQMKKQKASTRIKISNIRRGYIEEYMSTFNVSRAELAEICKIDVEYLNKILDVEIPTEIVLKIEKGIGLEPYSLVSLENFSTFFFD